MLAKTAELVGLGPRDRDGFEAVPFDETEKDSGAQEFSPGHTPRSPIPTPLHLRTHQHTHVTSQAWSPDRDPAVQALIAGRQWLANPFRASLFRRL